MFSYYLTDYESVDHMLTDAITNLCVKKYHKHVIYVHNLSHFDGIFLLRFFTELS
jgi:hypothetical protein